MEKQFTLWFSRLVIGADIVLLLASTPHIAAWFAHNDQAGNLLETMYAWVIGYLIALAIDGTSIAVLYGLIGLYKSKKKAPAKKGGVIACLVFLAMLSTYINWQYDVQNATDAFAKADAIQVFHYPLGNINPLIGGSFALLSIFYAVLSSLIQSDDHAVKEVLSDEEYAAEKKRLQREQELNELRKSGKKGLLSTGKEQLMGQSRTADELLEQTLIYLRDARELLRTENHELAMQALTVHLKIRSKNVLSLLIQARSIILKEDKQEQEARKQEAELLALRQSNPSSYTDREGDDEEIIGASVAVQEAADESPLNGLQGRDTVSLERAAEVLNCQVKQVVSLRNAGKLKHGPRRDDLITVASLKMYMSTRKRRKSAVSPIHKVQETEPMLHVVGN